MRTRVLVLAGVLVHLVCGEALRSFHDGPEEHHVRHREARKLRRLSRCRRYAQVFYRDYGCYYQTCGSAYCAYCPTSSCRRRCNYSCPQVAEKGTTKFARPATTTKSAAKECKCDPQGSQFPACDQNTGQCMCRPHYVGPKCSQCETGYWKTDTNCIPCDCNQDGSVGPSCDPETGVCACKPGVQGRKCDSCRKKHYGDIKTGCKECDRCDKEGHVCHPTKGKCVCPQRTHGSTCELCESDSWGHEPGIGCKPCACSETGSSKAQCDLVTGRCTCLLGFEGEKCDRCTHGHYGYPKCRECNCDRSGTLREDCLEGSCRCNDDGCRCKPNVGGQLCDTCKPGTFWLDPENPLGCTDCFCSGRSKQCVAATYVWDQIRTNDARQEAAHTCFTKASCWSLPAKFTGDLTTSYGGYLQVSSNSPQHSVYLVRDGIAVESATDSRGHVRMLEANWRMTSDTTSKMPKNCFEFLSRGCLMVVLQNVTKIQIESTSGGAVKFAEILLDKMSNLSGTSQAKSVEQCSCPEKYTSASCQDPNNGYYRYYPKTEETDNYIEKILGVARPCHCNNRSDICDKLTGHCLECRDHTSGAHCELCAEGYYKESSGKCTSCRCPSDKQNFAKNCTKVEGKKFSCECKTGYSGSKCNKCQDGYWGDLSRTGGSCQPCNCNLHGSDSFRCDKSTGNCICKSGFTGRNCSACTSPRHVIQDGVCVPCDECAQILFYTLDNLSEGLNKTLDLFKDGLGPPWGALESTAYEYKLLSKHFDDVEKAKKMVDDANLPELEGKIDKLKRDLPRRESAISEQTRSIDDLQQRSAKVAKTLGDLDETIGREIERIEQFGVSSVDVNKALSDAKVMLQTIIDIVGEAPSTQQHEELFAKCGELLQEIEDVYGDASAPEVIRAKLNELKRKLGDFNATLDKIDVVTKLTKKKNKQHARRIALLKDSVDEIQAKDRAVRENVTELLRKVNATNDLLTDIESICEELDAIDLENSTKDFEKFSTPDAYEPLPAVREHVRNLEDKIKSYRRLFNFTPDEWKKIDASGAYDNLVKRIQAARETALQARNVTFNTVMMISPPDNDSLPDRTNLAKAFSDRLEKRVINLKNLTKDFKDRQEELDELKHNILSNGKNNNDLNGVLRAMRDQLDRQWQGIQDLEKAKENARNVSALIASVDQGSKNINITMQHELVKMYSKYLELLSKDEISNLTRNISLTSDQLRQINGNIFCVRIYSKYLESAPKNETVIHGDELFEIINYLNCTDLYSKYSRGESLKEIKLSLEEVQEIVRKLNCTKFDIVKKSTAYSFGGKNKTKLDDVREKMKELNNMIKDATEKVDAIEYGLNVSNCERTYRLKNDIFRSLKVSFSCESCRLVRLGNSRQESVELNVRNNKVHVTWKDQNKTLDVISTVSLRRLGSTIEIKTDNDIATIFDREPFHIHDAVLRVGKLGNSSPEACLRKLVLNDQTVGLWKFTKSVGQCLACNGSISTDDLEDVFFNGDAYRDVTSSSLSSLLPSDFNIEFTFATFDEDSLLFLAQDRTNSCSYLTLNLDEGRLRLKVRHIDGTTVQLRTNQTYNSGEEMNFQVLMHKEGDMQTYSLKRLRSKEEELVNDSRPLSNKAVYKIKKSNVFIGGISSVLETKCLEANARQFVGHLKVIIGNVHVTNQNTFSYNVEPRSDKLEFYKTWFPGGSFVEVDFSSDGDIFSVTFFVRPVNVNNSHVMTIVDLMELYIENSSLRVKTSSEELEVGCISINNTHLVNITAASITVNRDLKNLSRPVEFSDKRIKFYMGSDVNSTRPSFVGSISDIFVNNRPVPFSSETVPSFRKVGIGRDDTSSLLFESDCVKEMQNTERYLRIPDHKKTDPQAFKFGDKPNSYIRIKNSATGKKYTLEFQFRTFYPNGLLFLSNYRPSGRNATWSYVVLEIQGGDIKLKVHGHRMKTMNITKKINDGMWHQVQIDQGLGRKKWRFTVKLDKKWKLKERIPRNNFKGDLFVGGVANEFPVHAKLRNELHPFRGCVRSLKINRSLQVVKNNANLSYSNLGQCFHHVEEGAYFGGDAYAIYKDDFKINKFLELSFEFKTGEPNGVLLSMSNPGNSPALSVELQNGAVVMTIDMGNDVISQVTNSPHSHSTLANNEYHNLTALYSSSELTVNVDGIRKSWVQSVTNSLMEEIVAPLYIGGLPNGAPSGTLKIKENFKGCIRKFKIEDNIMDWTDMKELNNVQLNSCLL